MERVPLLRRGGCPKSLKATFGDSDAANSPLVTVAPSCTGRAMPRPLPPPTTFSPLNALRGLRLSSPARDV
ncbi:hypothetical protein GCM10009754_49390 [Amycolatopsis minnesotensis]|uniref:Uncharacterized protein n=1 Tax=Amycolatopsis minnesotensis TaxID=337894 RepID=A0ABP5CVX3_9PSEU